MRVTPLVVWCANLSHEDIKKVMKADTEFVHADPIVQETVFIYACCLVYLLNNDKNESIADRALAAF